MSYHCGITDRIMSANLMADVDVSKQLDGIQKQVDRQDVVLEKVSEAVQQIAVVMAQQSNQNEKIQDLRDDLKDVTVRIHTRLDKQDERISVNNDKINRWAGMGSALAALIILLTLYERFGSPQV